MATVPLALNGALSGMGALYLATASTRVVAIAAGLMAVVLVAWFLTRRRNA